MNKLEDLKTAIPLYRAVSPNEYEDIKNNKKFRTVEWALSAKQFTSTVQCAIFFGENVVRRFDKCDYYIISVSVSSEFIEYAHRDYFMDNKDCQVITIYEDNLEDFNSKIVVLSLGDRY